MLRWGHCIIVFVFQFLKPVQRMKGEDRLDLDCEWMRGVGRLARRCRRG